MGQSSEDLAARHSGGNNNRSQHQRVTGVAQSKTLASFGLKSKIGGATMVGGGGTSS